MALKSCELKILSKQYEELPEIIKKYEKIANKYLKQPILKSNAKDLFFMSCLCFMANDDMIGAKKVMQSYCYEDPSFDGSREQQLVINMIECIGEKNRDEFQISTSEYNRMTPFSKVKTSLLAKIIDIHLPPDIIKAVDSDEELPDLTGDPTDPQKQKDPF